MNTQVLRYKVRSAMDISVCARVCTLMHVCDQNLAILATALIIRTEFLINSNYRNDGFIWPPGLQGESPSWWGRDGNGNRRYLTMPSPPSGSTEMSTGTHAFSLYPS